MLVPALTFGLQVECRKSVRKIFSVSNRLPQDTKDESRDLKDIQKLLNTLGKFFHIFLLFQKSHFDFISTKISFCSKTSRYHVAGDLGFYGIYSISLLALRPF